MPTIRRRTVGFALAALPGAALLAGRPARAATAPRYFFRIAGVKAKEGVAAETKDAARELLDKELSGRPEFTSDVKAEEADLPARLQARKLQGFDVTLQIEKLGEQLKAPRPGGRLKQLAVDVKLTVFGTTLPGAKLAFSGDGEAAIEAEIVEKRRQEEGAALTKDALTQAIRQAVDQAVAKLSRPRAEPMNEAKRKRKKT